METVCPVCNGLTEIAPVCPRCGQVMEDGGRRQDLAGPYSPYMEPVSAGLISDTAEPCVHLYFCPVCHTDRRVAVSRVLV